MKRDVVIIIIDGVFYVAERLIRFFRERKSKRT